MLDNKEFYNMIREHLLGIEKNTQKIADILQIAKRCIISIFICFVIYLIMKHIGFAP
jgi:hypothetical protein